MICISCWIVTYVAIDSTIFYFLSFMLSHAILVPSNFELILGRGPPITKGACAWGGGYMLWLKRFKRWCNNLQKLILLIFVTHNIFDHVKWHEVENARLGVGATTTSRTITKVKWGGEWRRVCNQTWSIKSKLRKVLISFVIWSKRL